MIIDLELEMLLQFLSDNGTESLRLLHGGDDNKFPSLSLFLGDDEYQLESNFHLFMISVNS